MNEFIEQKIIEAVRKLLTVKVNELLADLIFFILPIEFGNYTGNEIVTPNIALSTCERTEKERIIRTDAYSLTITFNLPETQESELYCYAYSCTVGKAIHDNPTLDGVVDKAVITGKKYIFPKKPNCGEGYGLAITLRLTAGEVF